MPSRMQPAESPFETPAAFVLGAPMKSALTSPTKLYPAVESTQQQIPAPSANSVELSTEFEHMIRQGFSAPVSYSFAADGQAVARTPASLPSELSRLLDSPAASSDCARGQWPSTDSLLDRQQKIIAQLLLKYRNWVELAAKPIPDGATKESVAAEQLQMDLEVQSLIREAENLLKLSRELKELWLFGPLKEIGEERQIAAEDNAVKTELMIEGMLEKMMELSSV